MSSPRNNRPPEREYSLLVNPSAGGGRSRDRLPAALAALEAAGACHRVAMTEDLDHGVELALAAAERGQLPVVMSGDGLIGRVGGALAGSETPLGIIPGGRGNDLARVLGISEDPREAVATLLADDRRRIDVGTANDVRFLCIASCGFDSDANRIANSSRFVKGAPVYAYAAIRALAQWKPATFTITADDETTSYEGFSVAVANSKAYGGGMFVAPDARLDDGLLDLTMTHGRDKLGFIRSLPRVFDGTHIENDAVHTARAAEVEVSADRPFDVYADGERICELPMRVRLMEGALSVIAPPLK